MKLHQSVNKIIVTELNPMSDAPDDFTFLAFTIMGGTCWELYKTQTGHFASLDDQHVFEERHLQGWLPMPVYDPSAKSPKDRYEKLRKLNVRQFAELFERNLRGENFDEMVDAL